MRICSFLPSATEIVYLLGLESELFGVTHECDYPSDARDKPKLTSSAINNANASSPGIDLKVRDSLKSGKGIYSLNYAVLREASPDLILTQELCEVCAVTYGEIYRAASTLDKKPEIVSLDTFTLQDILDSIIAVGKKSGKAEKAKEVILALNNRIEKVTELSKTREKRRIFFMEWIEPIMSCGHWMPELILRAGGDDVFGRYGKNSRRVDWKDVVAYEPEFLIIAPCGFGVEKAREEARHLTKLEGWSGIPAVQNGNVFLADGNAYFSRPGPRIVDGLEILSLIFHPETAIEYRDKYSKTDYARFDA